MLMGAAPPAHNLHPFHSLRAAGVRQCIGGPSLEQLKYSQAQKSETSSNEVTRKHLFNLGKLLQKEQLGNSPDAVPALKHPSQESRSRGFFDGLNIAGVWPEMKAAQEMSPRNLNKLKRLLSKSPEYSPRNNLGSRWREYHGCNDWTGLLDPLDENLRREVVRYGEFIQAAYHCFHSNPATSSEVPYESRHVALPDKSYKVTKSLYATSSIGLPKWLDEMVPDLRWMTQRSSWIGYVAVCDDRREIQRMGRRDITIALRGTATCLEWAENLRDFLVPISKEDDKTAKQPRAECGFLSLLRTRGRDQLPSLAESVVDEIHRLVEKYKGETLSITITGHSLGAALALLVGDELSNCGPNMPPMAVFSFGGPRVGDRSFADSLRAKNVKVLRIVNRQDVVTRVPGMFVSEELDKMLREHSASNKLLDAVDRSMPWAYAHVGAELRVDTKMSPYLKPHSDAACCHDLEAYLHLVDGFSASNCPFRTNAKRSLLRLLNEQRSNVKRLYTSNAKALNLSLETKSVLATPSCLPSPS